MTLHVSPPSGGMGYSPFEQELVNAMNEYASSSDAPQFDAAVIARVARRKRATAIAGISAALILAGGGTALAAAAAGGSHTAAPAATSHTTTADKNATTVLYGFKNGGTVPLELGGLDPVGARALLSKAQITPQFGKASSPGCKPTSVIAVSPHAPAVVHKGETVKVTLCAG
ncbi:hypothetical protein [Streptomyces sp. NBC_00370]|uniref:hypothetical protein n=1 Tax=Streptomyces sp. NBC_00370 TaxID=2975728 RepID=UPI002E2545AD